MKYALKAAAVLLCGIILGLALILGVFLLPTEPMFNNAKESGAVFDESTMYPEMIPGYSGSMLDNFTDALMISNAITDIDAPLADRAMSVYRPRIVGETNSISALKGYLETGEYEATGTYARYWHGYLVTLKPMLMMFDYGQIRIINIALFALLGLAVLLLIWKKTSLKYSLGFLAAMLFIMPIAIPFSLQFSTIMYITLFALLGMLIFHEKLNKNNRYIYFFLAVGMITSYMDYLTYPLAALGVPMVLLMLLCSEETLKQKITKIILLSVCFGVGYIGMWGAKWVVGSLLTGKDIIADALSTMDARTGMETAADGTITLFDVFAKNLKMIGELPFVLIALATLITETVLIATKGIEFKKIITSAIPFLIIAVMPFAWQIVASNHSYEHAWFTYRAYLITAFALITMLSSAFELKQKQKRVIDKIIK